MDTPNPSGIETGVSIGYTVPLHSEDGRVADVHRPGPLRVFSADPGISGPSAGDSEAIRRALGIDDATWQRHNHGREASRVAAFSASAPKPTLAEIKQCSEFLADLAKLTGANAYEVGRADHLFFDLVIAPRDSKWDDEPPGRYPGSPLDVEKAETAGRELLGDYIKPAWDHLSWLDRIVFDEQHGGEASSKLPFRPSLAEMWRAAGFLAGLASHGMLYSGKERAAVELFFQWRSRRRTAKG